MMLSVDSLEEKFMLALYFGNIPAVLTTLFLLAILLIVLLAVQRRVGIAKWGRLTALIILIGTAVSALSAVRDGYGAQQALFPMDGAQSLICSIAGGAIYLTGIACLFLRRQSVRRAGFFIAASLMAVQVAVVEASRIVFLMGGRL
jgi:hypothetical protein